jgi:DNA-binding protein Fis
MNKKITPSEVYEMVIVKKIPKGKVAKLLKVNRCTITRNLKKYI